MLGIMNPRLKPIAANNLDRAGFFHVGKKSPIETPLKTNPIGKIMNPLIKGKMNMQTGEIKELKPKTAAPLIE